MYDARVRVRESVRGGIVVAGSYGATVADLVETLDVLARHVDKSRSLLDRTFPPADASVFFVHASHSIGKLLPEVAP